MIDPSEEKISTELYNYIETNNILCENIIVDIGANDGFEISNSYYFIQNGWQGILVEPLQFLNETINRNLSGKNIQIIHAAVTNHNGKAMFFSHPNDDRQSRSSEIHYSGSSLEFRGGQKEMIVETINFAKLIELTNLGNVGILSIDTEGHDSIIIESMLQTKLRPKFIITEKWIDNGVYDKSIKILNSNQYSIIINKNQNSVLMLND